MILISLAYCIMRRLEIKHLRMIRAIADTGNMTRAAGHLGISQSGLSQQLKDIEGKLAGELFFRTPKQMIPTAIGARLLETAITVVDAIDAAEMAIEKAVAGSAGELRLGTQCHFCYKWLPHVMKAFQDQFPGIDVEIGNASDPAEELLSRRFDIVIGAAPTTDDRCVEVPLFEDQLVCIMSVGHPLSRQPHVSLADFGRYKLITHVERSQSKIYQLMLKPKGIEPLRLMTVSSPQAIVALVTADFGLSAFPAWAVRTAVSAGSICARPITSTGIPLTWRAAYLKTLRMPAYYRAFIQFLQDLGISDIGSLPDDPATGGRLSRAMAG
jgi:LysR family transcriptional regulator, regulator for metE and metH